MKYSQPKAREVLPTTPVKGTVPTTQVDANQVGFQTHVHEFTGSTRLAGDPTHNHRFAGVSSQAIPVAGNHVHTINTSTDFDIEHLHEIGMVTGTAIYVGDGRHVHYAAGLSTLNRGHAHEFVFATLIEDPLR